MELDGGIEMVGLCIELPFSSMMRRAFLKSSSHSSLLLLYTPALVKVAANGQLFSFLNRKVHDTPPISSMLLLKSLAIAISALSMNKGPSPRRNTFPVCNSRFPFPPPPRPPPPSPVRFH